eukprot:14433538-Ditylum_brightwellii.AAC.2
MKEAAEFVPFQLPNELTRVGFLLAAIKHSYSGLHAVMVNIRSDVNETSTRSKKHQFELIATNLLPFCSVLKKFPSAPSVMPSRFQTQQPQGLE